MRADSGGGAGQEREAPAHKGFESGRRVESWNRIRNLQVKATWQWGVALEKGGVGEGGGGDGASPVAAVSAAVVASPTRTQLLMRATATACNHPSRAAMRTYPAAASCGPEEARRLVSI